MSGPSYCGWIVEKWTDASLKPALAAFQAWAERSYAADASALTLHVYAHKGAAYLFLEDPMGSFGSARDGADVLKALAEATGSHTWELNHVARSSFGVSAQRCSPQGTIVAELEYGDHTVVPKSVGDTQAYIEDLVITPICKCTGWSKELLRTNATAVFGPDITDLVPAITHALEPTKRVPRAAASSKAARPRTQPPAPPPPPATPPFAEWEAQPKIARRCAAALPLFLAMAPDGKPTRQQALSFTDTLRDDLQFPWANPTETQNTLHQFSRAVTYAGAPECVAWVARTLRKPDDREIPLWLLVDHVLQGPRRDVSALLAQLLGAFEMPTREFVRRMLDNDVTVEELPRMPIGEADRRGCVMTPEGKCLRFVAQPVEDADDGDDDEA